MSSEDFLEQPTRGIASSFWIRTIDPDVFLQKMPLGHQEALREDHAIIHRHRKSLWLFRPEHVQLLVCPNDGIRQSGLERLQLNHESRRAMIHSFLTPVFVSASRRIRLSSRSSAENPKGSSRSRVWAEQEVSCSMSRCRTKFVCVSSSVACYPSRLRKRFLCSVSRTRSLGRDVSIDRGTVKCRDEL